MGETFISAPAIMPAVLGVLSARVCIAAADQRGGFMVAGAFGPAGHAHDEHAGQPLQTVLGGPVDAILNPHLEAAVAGRVSRWEGWLDAVDGQERYVEHVFLPPSGETAGVLIVTRDLTADKTAERESEQQRLDLLQSEKLGVLSSLLSGVAHELNNPLAILLAQATVLESRAETDDIRERAGKIHAAAERASRILKRFLGMAGERSAERRPTDLRQVTEAAVEVTGSGRRRAGIELEFEQAPSVCLAVADAHLMGQAVTTLLVNATQALSERPAPRRLWVATRSGADTVTVEVADNGPDLVEEDQARFPDSGPTGIGLSIPRSIVHSHGGTLELEAREGGGTRVRIALPAAAREPEAIDGTTSPEGLSILIVDDERDVAEALADMLRLIGHRTVLAGTVAEALALAREGSLDMVFADLRMPSVDGIELHRRMLAQSPDLQGRFVLVTGDSVSAPGLDLPVLEKPFSFRDVRAILANMRPL